MALTASQLATLKADIAANTSTIPAGQPWTGSFAGQQVNAVTDSGDGNVAIAGWYNLTATPSFTLWRKAVPLAEIANSLNGSELAGLTTANHTRLQTVITLLSFAGGANPSDADQRAFWDDIFSGAGGSITRVALLAIWKKLASNIQRLLATGTGSDASPATTQNGLGDSFAINGMDVEAARNLP